MEHSNNPAIGCHAHRTALLATMLMAFSGSSTPTTAAEVGSQEKCQLHIWPTKMLSAANAGSGMSGILPALIAGSSEKQGQLASAVLDGPGQLSQIMTANPVSLFKLPADTVVVAHEAPEIKTPVGEAEPTFEAGCRYELRVGSISYNRHPLYGKDILSYFAFQKIDADGKIAKKYKKQARVKMHDFPKNSLPKDEEERQVMAGMMNEAFKAGLVKFVTSFKEFR